MILIPGLQLPYFLVMLEVEFVTPVFKHFPSRQCHFCFTQNIEDLKCIMTWLEISHIVAGEIL